MQEHFSLQQKIQDESLDIREQIDKYVKFWPWFLFSMAMCFIVAFLYLRYTVPQYKAAATILVKDERKGGLQSELSAFADLGLMTGIKNNVDNEIEIIKSRYIIESAIKKLNFNVSYSTEGRVKTVELYKNCPIEVSFFDTDASFYEKKQEFVVNSKEANTFELSKVDGKQLGVFKYGSLIRLASCKMVVTKRPLIKSLESKEFSIVVKINKLESVVQSYKNRMSVASLNKNSSVVELSLNDAVADKAEDLLNTVIEIYNQDAIDDKNYISRNTQKFINERLKFITAELGDVEKLGENFMTANRLTDIASDANSFVQNSVSFEKALIETETQIKVVNSMLDYMNSSSRDDIIPSNIIPSDNSASDQINQYNGYIIERNRIAGGGATQKNSVIINFNNRIDDMRKSIKESLKRLVVSLSIKKGDLQKQDTSLNNKISQIPRQARESNVIGRQQKIKETLYLYLLQKEKKLV
ncbi:MAG: Wzz/FepE/Etk N-terminal domain-containing protein [Flavobacterium sp. JAD_PAG50586_2]|nr:MAG: Wzz/FepE/Etk N-terminal domain-containing protein [Flavobacterium sp. JAD_PAG50586_2]